MAQRKRSQRKKKVIKGITSAIVHIKATFNNTIVALTDKEGNVLISVSSGMAGFSGSKKSTPFAAQQATVDMIRRAKDAGIRDIEIWIKGPGPGKDAVIKSFNAAGFRITRIRDLTPVPHNGCRPKKKRRV